MVSTLDGLKKMKAAKIEDIKNCAPTDDCINRAVDICRRKVAKKSFMCRVMRIAKRILRKADSESYIYDCMWCSLNVCKLCGGDMMIWVRVANDTIFDYIVTAPKYAKFSKKDLTTTHARCFEVLQKAFIDAGFEVKEPSVHDNLYGQFEPYGSFHFVF